MMKTNTMNISWALFNTIVDMDRIFKYIFFQLYTSMDLNELMALTVQQFSLWASYQIRKIAGCTCAGNAGNVFPRRRFQRKLLVSDPGMHHGTCVTHVPWCMSGSLTCGDGENVPGIPGACAPAILRIWQEAHYRRAWALTHLPLNKMVVISQTTSSNAFSWMKSFVFWLEFYSSLFLRV